MTTTNRTIDEATKRLVEGFAPALRRVILFGSRARGTADDRSDVDLLVIVPLRDPGDSRERADLTLAMDRALRGLRLARDIVLLTPEEFERDRELPGTVAREAWRDGRALYDSAA